MKKNEGRGDKEGKDRPDSEERGAENAGEGGERETFLNASHIRRSRRARVSSVLLTSLRPQHRALGSEPKAVKYHSAQHGGSDSVLSKVKKREGPDKEPRVGGER